MTYLRIIVLLAIVLFNHPVSGADVSTPSAADVTFGVSGDVRTFLDNIEYSTSYQTGETIFGASAAFRFFFEPSVHTRFAFGVYGLRLFGDENFLTRTLPLFRAQYESERVSFILGEIISSDAHGLPDIAYRQEFRFDPGIEEGIQVRVRLKHFKEDHVGSVGFAQHTDSKGTFHCWKRCGFFLRTLYVSVFTNGKSYRRRTV